MDKLDRHLSVQFSTKNFNGIRHTEILDELTKHIDIKSVSAIQITEKNCIITLKDDDTKNLIISKELSIRDRTLSLVEIDKTITNVTIKDAPVEFDNCYIATQMLKYGSVVPGSVKRGVIRGTDIDNGSRYLQIVNCVKILPNRTMFGKYEVRIFADNNRTACVYCNLTSHPSYRCHDRPPREPRKCRICQEWGHIASQCKATPLCSYCNTEGHLANTCAKLASDRYGDYAHEIAEGRAAQLEDELRDKVSEDNEAVQPKPKLMQTNVLLGASNCKRLNELDESVVNSSISGTIFENVEQCIKLTETKLEKDKAVDNVVICLGTNDISKNVNDTDEITLDATNAVSVVKSKFPQSKVGVCNIIPRKGASNKILKMNDAAACVNKFLDKLCQRDPQLHLIDIASDFFHPDGNVQKSMFDKSDSSGVHIGPKGADSISSRINDFLHWSEKSSDSDPKTPLQPDRKRNRSEITPNSSTNNRQSKQHRADQDKEF